MASTTLLLLRRRAAAAARSPIGHDIAGRRAMHGRAFSLFRRRAHHAQSADAISAMTATKRATLLRRGLRRLHFDFVADAGWRQTSPGYFLRWLMTQVHFGRPPLPFNGHQRQAVPRRRTRRSEIRAILISPGRAAAKKTAFSASPPPAFMQARARPRGLKARPLRYERR